MVVAVTTSGAVGCGVSFLEDMLGICLTRRKRQGKVFLVLSLSAKKNPNSLRVRAVLSKTDSHTIILNRRDIIVSIISRRV